MVAMTRPQHGARRRCSTENCKQFARRNTVPPMCTKHGGGTRAAKKHTIDPDTGDQVTEARGLLRIPARIQALLDGTLPVEELDEEELARGYPRATDGSFRSPPVVIPRVIHQRMTRELFDRAGRHLKANLTKVAEQMTAIALDPEVDPAVRLKASIFLIERIMGKTPDVSVTMDEKRYEQVIERMNRDAIIVDAEVSDGRTP